MNFEKAHKELMQGKKIRRKAWDPYMHMKLVDGKVKTYQGENINYYTDTNILISTGWKVVDGDGKELTFLEALEELKIKKSITRDNMPDAHIFVDQGSLAMCRAVEYEFMPNFQCLCANDWEIYK